jgi:hypothetical protein
VLLLLVEPCMLVLLLLLLVQQAMAVPAGASVYAALGAMQG